MFIQTETTPNPTTLKFLPGLTVMETGTADFRTVDKAKEQSPLAKRLFDIAGVQGVFFGSDFITITKDEDKEWYLLKPSILGVIMEHFTAGRAVISAPASETASPEDEDEIVIQIKELLETRVRPFVAQDGGDIVYHNFEEGIVYLTMQGACAGCPSSTATLKLGIENMLKHYIPEVVEVQAVA